MYIYGNTPLTYMTFYDFDSNLKKILQPTALHTFCRWLLSMSDCTFFTEFLSDSDLPHPARTEGAQIRCPKVFLC